MAEQRIELGYEARIGGTAMNLDLGRKTHGVPDWSWGCSDEVGAEGRVVNTSIVDKI